MAAGLPVGATRVGGTPEIVDATTGEVLTPAEARDQYSATQFEARLHLPDRVAAIADDLA
jgi:hypothetical protein